MAESVFLPKPSLSRVPANFLSTPAARMAISSPRRGGLPTRRRGLPWVAGGLRVRRRGPGSIPRLGG